MDCRSPQNTGTEITENYIHRNKEKDDLEKSFLSHKKLEEYKKVQKVLLTFSSTKPKNESDLRKFLINIAASSTRLLAILEDIPLQETTGCRAKTKAYHRCDEYDKSSTKDQSIPKKINRHLEQKNNDKNEQIPRVTIRKLCDNNKLAYVAYIDNSLHENDDHTVNDKTPDSVSSQHIEYPQKNTTQTFLQEDEICNTDLNNETEVVFECKNVEPTITSFAPQKSEYMSENQLQHSEISKADRATFKDEQLDMVKKEYFGNSIEKVNLNNDCESNGQNEIILPLNSIRDSNESEKLETCSKKFVNNSNLKVHKDFAPDHITHPCEICGKKFMQKHKLKIHTEAVHNGQKLYQCDTCGKTFGRKDQLDRHINSIHIDNTLTCDASRKTIAQKDYLINPIGLVHNSKKSHECGTRGKSFRQKVGPKEQIESPRRSITYTCDSREKTFTRKSNLKNHIDFVHKNLKHLKCDRCPKAFSSKRGLDLHMSTVHNGITYKCDLCYKIFTQKTYLRIHINTVHMGKGKLFKCDECPKSFNYKCQLTSHIKYAHKGVTHPCDLCEKIFRNKSGLKLHKDFVHKGITHPCDYCRKVFTQKSHLNVHKDFVHKGITHPCDLCKKVFAHKNHLKRHKDALHYGITHQCDQCEKSFTQKANLKLHINEVHNGKK